MGQIIVKSPVTSNGLNPILDAKGQIIYKTAIVEEYARPLIEKSNLKLPQHLKKIIEPIGSKKPVVLVPYAKRTVEDLTLEIKARGIPVPEKAKLKDLVELLESDDETRE